MNETYKDRVDRWYEHIRVLAEDIGPRGSTTEAEREGAVYCQDVLKGLGLEARLEGFTSARSIYHPHVVSAIGLLIAFAVYPLAGRTTAGIAAILTGVMLACELLELGFRPNPLRWLIPKGRSQNTVATIDPTGEVRQDVVLIGHVDSHRSPIIFSSDRWLAFYGAFIAIAFASFVMQFVLFALGAVWQWWWVWYAVIPSAGCAAVLLAICLQADATPYSPGANDNATAAGLVLTLGEHLRTEPPAHSRVWLACTGCEEVQHYGARDLFRRHKDAMTEPKAVVFESLGCDGPAWLKREGIIILFQADPQLRELAERLAADRPELKAYATQIMGGNTELADAVRAGVPAITLCGITRDGKLPYWHRPGDTVDKIDREVLSRAYAYSWAYLRALDDAASPQVNPSTHRRADTATNGT